MVKVIIFGVDADINDEELFKETGAQSSKRIIKRYGGNYIKNGSDVARLRIGTSFLCLGINDTELTTIYLIQSDVSDVKDGGIKRIHAMEKKSESSAQNNTMRGSVLKKEKENEQRELKCTNCGGKHAASYQGCAKFKIAKDVTEIQFNSGTKITYAEAIKKRHSEIELKENKNQIQAIDGNQPPKSNQYSLPFSGSGNEINPQMPNLFRQPKMPKRRGCYTIPPGFLPSSSELSGKYVSWVCFRGQGNLTVIIKKFYLYCMTFHNYLRL